MRARIAATTLASVVLGTVSFAAARAEPGYFPGGPGAGIALLGTAAGWAATAAGLVTWRAGRSGPLLAFAGTAWLLAACSCPELGSAVVFTAALAGGLAAPALMAHALRPGAAIVAAGYGFAVGLAGVGQAVFFDPAAEDCGACPDNLLLVHADADVRLEMMRIGMAGTAGILVVALLIAAARLYRAPAARRAGEAVFALPVGAFAAAAAAQLVHARPASRARRSGNGGVLRPVPHRRRRTRSARASVTEPWYGHGSRLTRPETDRGATSARGPCNQQRRGACPRCSRR